MLLHNVCCSGTASALLALALFIYENIIQNIALRYVTLLLASCCALLLSELGALLFTFIANFCVATLMEMG